MVNHGVVNDVDVEDGESQVQRVRRTSSWSEDRVQVGKDGSEKTRKRSDVEEAGCKELKSRKQNVHELVTNLFAARTRIAGEVSPQRGCALGRRSSFASRLGQSCIHSLLCGRMTFVLICNSSNRSMTVVRQSLFIVDGE